jgi:hypothetical protein
MRSRDRILANLDTVYQESYDRAKAENLPRRMEELDAAYMRDQLMMEVLLDIRELLDRSPKSRRRAPFSNSPNSPASSANPDWYACPLTRS